jgi:hypothetical protein
VARSYAGWLAAGALAACGGGGSTGDPVDAVPGAPDASPPVDCTMVTCRYIRADAPAGGDGTDWGRAWSALPDALDRGTLYYLAAGTYPGYTFDDAAAGTTPITVRAATASDHGAGGGWDDEFAGVAELGPVALVTPYHVLDGNGRNIRIRGAFEGTAMVISGDDQIVRSLDVDGAFAADGTGQHVGGACTVMDVSGDNVTIAGSELHDAADDGAVFSGTTGLRFEGNVVHRLHGCGTDGGCGPCFNGHSDGLEMFDVEQSVVRGNLIYDVRSTATVFFGNWGTPDQYNEDITIENNVFYAPEVGLVVYIHYARNIRFLHNVVWGVHQGSYGGLSVGPDVTDLEMHNNILLSVNLAHTGGTFDPAEHRGSHNLIGIDNGQWPMAASDREAADPGFSAIPDADGAPVDDPAAEAFGLAAGSAALDAGATAVPGVALPATDFFGRPRGAMPDVGAIERQP